MQGATLWQNRFSPQHQYVGCIFGGTRGTGKIRKSHHIRVFLFDSGLVELSNLGYRCSTYRLGRGYKTHIGEGVFGNKRV